MRPSRAEAERDAMDGWPDVIRDVYERQFLAFCRETGLDPEDTSSVLLYEEEWEAR